jgi:hypothetical protein
VGPREGRRAPRLGAAALSRFHRFVAIDWSGASGERHRGIAVASCGAGDAAPALVRPGHRWSRAEVLAWLAADLPGPALVGLDLGCSLPFADRGAFFPGWGESPADARALWALVERIAAAEPHLGAAAFVDHPDASRHFRRHGGRTGDRFGIGRGRWRVTEAHQARLGLRPTSNLNLVGAAQVGKASLTGMRVLHRLPARLPVWPFDPVPAGGSAVVEIYTSLAALAAGRPPARAKMRTGAELDAGLAALGSAASGHAGAIADHASDALLAAAWLRRVADDPRLWAPAAMTPALAATEGWTFGVP